MGVLDVLKGLAKRADDWASVTSGFGGTLDRVKSLFFRWDGTLDDETLESLFAKHALAARIVEHPVREAMREGFRIVVAESQPMEGEGEDTPAEDPDKPARADAFPPKPEGDDPAPPFGAPAPPPAPKDPKLVKAQLAKKLARSKAQRAAVETSTAMAMAFRDLHAHERIIEGRIWGRLFGGGAIIMGVVDGRKADLPVNDKAIKALRYLHVVDRRNLTPKTYYRDIMHPSFGRPETYWLTPVVPQGASLDTNGADLSMRVIHETRVIRFGGQLTSEYRRPFAQGWDFSILDRIYVALRRYDSIWLSVAAVMSDLSQGVIKIKDLWAKIAGGEYEVLKTRLELMEQNRSSAKAIVLDLEEEYERKTTPISGVDGVLDRASADLAAHVGWPQTQLFMRAPAGLNATGESDAEMWDGVLTDEQKELTCAVERIAEILFLAKEGPTKGVEPEEWDVKWNPTRKATPEQLGTIRKQQAETDKLRIDTKVLSADVIRRARWRPEGYQDELMVDPDEIEQQEAEEEIARAEQAEASAKDAEKAGADDAAKKAADEEAAQAGDKALLAKMRARAA